MTDEPVVESPRQMIARFVQHYGHARLALELSAELGWQAGWYPQGQAERISKAAHHLAQAYDLIHAIEEEERAKREGKP